MTDLIAIIISALLVYVIGYPLIEWFRQMKDEMEEKKHDDDK